jgi:hypothetical protein
MTDEPLMSSYIEMAVVPGSRRRVGRLYYEIQTTVGRREPETRTTRIYFPMDRRQARRVSRRTGHKFRVIRARALRWRER